MLPCSSLENQELFFLSPKLTAQYYFCSADRLTTHRHHTSSTPTAVLPTKTRQLSATLPTVYDTWWHCKEIPCRFSSVTMATAASQTRWCWLTFVSRSAQRELCLMQLLQLPTPTSNRSNDRLEMFQWLETRIISSGYFPWNLSPSPPPLFLIILASFSKGWYWCLNQLRKELIAYLFFFSVLL